MLGASALVISTFSLLLFLDFTSRIEAGDAREIGTITYKKRVSQRKYGSQVIWEDVDNNSPVYVNDSIRTADLSQAVVRLKDGTTIELDENSMILLAETSGAININFAQGTMYARRAAVAEAGTEKVNIVSGDATVAVEQSDVKLSQSEGKQLDLTVSKGTAVVTTGSEEKILTQNQSAVLLKDAPVQVREVPLKLVSPEPNRYFISSDAKLAVSFSWEPTGDAKNVYFELSRERDFSAIVARRRAAGTAAGEAVPSGEYYWRLKGEGPGGRAEFSEVRKFSVITDRPVQLMYPSSGEVVTYVQRPPLINFRWGRNDIATKYTLEIAKDQAFAQKVSSVSTTLTGLAVDTLPEGTYFWRVSTTAGLGDPAYSGRSGVNRLVINRQRVVERTELISPGEGAAFSALQAREKGVICSWKLVGGINRYELLVSSDKGFGNIVHRDTVTGNFTRIVKDFAQGSYFWKVRPIAEEATGAAFTSARSFSVIGGEGISLIAPVNNIETKPGRDEKSMAVDFSWSRSPIEGRYRLEISREPGFANLFHGSDSDATASKVGGVTPGKYYWRVKVVDSDRTELFRSQTFSLVVREADITPVKATVVITSSDEKGEIFVNGKLAGRGKVTVTPDPGTIKIAVTADGYRKYERDLPIRAGDKQELRAELEKLPEKATVVVSSSAPRGAIYVNGALAGYGTVTLRPEAGPLKVAVVAPGFQKYEKELVLRAGEKQELRAELEAVKVAPKLPEKATVVVASSAPRGAVYVNGRLAGYGTVTVKQNPGTVNIAVVAAGYRKFEKELVVRAGERQELRAELELLQREAEKKAATDIPVAIRLKSAPGMPITAKPLVQNDVIVTTSAAGIVSGVSQTGGPGWKTKLGSRIESTPVADESGVYVVTTKGELVSMDARSGAVRWKKDAGGAVLFSSKPLIAENRIFIATSQGNVTAYDRAGKQLWRKKLGGGVYSSPAYQDGVLYIGTDDRKINALASRDGRTRWQFETDSRMVGTTPLVFRGNVYAGTYSGSFYAINARRGTISWHFKAGMPIIASPVAGGSTIFTGSMDGYLYALNADSGRLAWKYPAGERIMMEPLLGDGMVYLASQKTFHVISADSGAQLWKVNLRRTIKTPPAGMGNDVLVGLDNGEMVTLRPSSKEVVR